MAQTAQILYNQRPKPSRLSPLILMTEAKRLSYIENAVARLPEGSAVIYRHFGAEDRHVRAATLRKLTTKLHHQFLIGDDPELAVESGADGVHFRRDAKVEAPNVWRQKKPHWLITMAGLKIGTYSGDLSGLDGLFLSSIFPSQSPSAGHPIGVEALTGFAGQLNIPIFALGGISPETAPELVGSGAAGLAGVSGITA